MRTIREQFGLEHKDAKRRINQFHAAWPIVRELQDDVVRIANKRGYIKTPWGRRLHMEEFGEHKLANKLIQGSAAHALKRALIRVFRFLAEHDVQSHMVLTIHDSIMFDGPAEEAGFLHEHVPRLMTDEPLICAVVPLLVDHDVSPRYWSEKFPYEEWRQSLGDS